MVSLALRPMPPSAWALTPIGCGSTNVPGGAGGLLALAVVAGHEVDGPQVRLLGFLIDHVLVGLAGDHPWEAGGNTLRGLGRHWHRFGHGVGRVSEGLGYLLQARLTLLPGDGGLVGPGGEWGHAGGHRLRGAASPPGPGLAEQPFHRASGLGRMRQ